MEELLSLKWNNHKSTFLHILTILRDKQMYTDVTLACEGKFYSVHRLVLSTCSDYFSAMFDRTECKKPIIVLKDISCLDLEALLDYMYLGEVNVKQSELSSLIKAAECLRVKGLAVPDDEIPKKGSSGGKRSERNNLHSPSGKRRRKDDDDSSMSNSKSSRRHLHNDSVSNSSRAIQPSTSEIIEEDDKIQFVKVEKEDSVEDSFDINNSEFKVENDDDNDPGVDSNEMPEFLPSDDHFDERSYGGSSFQPGDVDWPGEGSTGTFGGQLNFSTGTNETSENASGDRQSRGAANDTVAKTCLVCDKTFPFLWHLQRHMRTHTGEKPYACPYCPHRASDRSNFKRHMLAIHNEKRHTDDVPNF